MSVWSRLPSLPISPEPDLDAAWPEPLHGVRPGAAGPVVDGDALGRPVLGGVQGAEALTEPGGVQRGTQARRHHAGDATARVEQRLQMTLPLNGPDRRGVRRPLHLALVVGGHGLTGDV